MGRRMTAVAAGAAVALALGGAPADAQVVRQLTDERTTVSSPGALDDAGASVYAGSTADLAGTNPEHAAQIWRFDPVTGAATQLTSDPRGLAAIVSVNDDGQWLAFASAADPMGTNHDRSPELFVMRSDGTGLAQLTSDPAPNAGSVSGVAISGDASRIAFASNTDPLGTNPAHRSELFVIDRSGANLRQLTQATAGSLGGLSISDDGTRVAFAHSGDLLGTNADLGSEIFAVNADGTGLRQLTAAPDPHGSGAPSLAGGGLRVAFQSDADPLGLNLVHQVEVFVVDWTGANLRQLTRTTVVFGITGAPTSQAPSITDDGQTIVYHSNQSSLFPFLNADGNYEVFKIKADGTGRTVLTNTILAIGSLLPVVSGSGTRIAYYALDTNVTLRAIDGNGGAGRNLLVFDMVFLGAPDLTPDGARLVFARTAGLFEGGEVWTIESDGTGLAQVTNLASGGAATPSIAADAETIVFSADGDPTGGNGDLSGEIFTIDVNGTGTVQLTSGPAGTSSANPVVAASAPVVVFDSDADLVGSNADASREVYRVNLDASGLVQLTSGPVDTTSHAPRVDASGTWVVFESNADLDGGNADGSYEVFRVRADGGQLERLTGDPVLDARLPDVSADGARISFVTAADPLGTNPEGNSEVFVHEPAATAATLRQLTSFATGASAGARLSRDGAWVYFSSSAPIFEDDPDEPTDLYRVPAAGGAIERVGALRSGGGGDLAPDAPGTVVAMSGLGDLTLGNPDGLAEIWVIDRAGVPDFDVGRPSLTVLRWTAGSGPVRYDAIRGDVANLAFAGSEVDLGPVVCLEDDSPDPDTEGFGDPVDPAPGQAFFFVYRGSQGLLDGPGSYGPSSDGRERVAGSGDCPEAP